ncbi:DUF4870 domain-containing protein [Leucobacter luti]|uniref:DUF4870 domain-containing protein n=1 Tax=Leucobacter luti TaxID=340320 RepID=UPI003D020487
MTTLPPEGQDGQATGDQPSPDQPQAQTPPPAAPQAPQPPVPPQQPAQPQYQTPPPAAQTPPAGGYQAPPAGGYQTPPPGAGQVPPQGYAQPTTDPASTITLNYWLSVFFTWIPALIFYIIEKDKGNAQAYAYHRDNLNFSLLRVMVVVATYILMLIPYVGWILGAILWIGSVVLFVFHIIAAVKAPDAYRRGEQPGFIFNIPLVK